MVTRRGGEVTEVYACDLCTSHYQKSLKTFPAEYLASSQQEIHRRPLWTVRVPPNATCDLNSAE